MIRAKESIFKPVLIIMSGRVIGYAAAFIVPVVLARILEQSEFGTYKQLFLIFSTLYSVAQLGLAESLFYFLPTAPRSQGGRFAINAMILLTLSGILSLAAVWYFQSTIAKWLNNDLLIGYLPLIGWYLFLMLCSSLLEIIMTVKKRHLHASLSYAFTDIFRSILSIVPVLIFDGLDWLLYGLIIFALIRFGTMLVYLFREYKSSLRPDLLIARRQIAYAAPFSLYVLMEVLQINLHQYAVSFQVDAATFAIYAVGCLSIPLVDFLASSSTNVLMVRLREHVLNNDKIAILALWGDITRKLLMIFAPIATCLLIVSNELIIGLFTERYSASIPIFMIWTIALLFSFLLTDAVLRVYSELRFLMLLGVVKLLFIGFSISLFITLYGLPGAVLSVLLTVIISKSVALYRIRKVTNCNWSEFLPWSELGKIVSAAILAGIPAVLLNSSIETNEYLLLFAILSVTYFLSFILILWYSNILNDEEKSGISEWISKPVTILVKRS